jgi:hypothetical protein
VSAGSAAGSRHFIDPPHAEPIACRPVVHGCAVSRVKSVHGKQRPSALNRVTEPPSGAELHPAVEAAGVAAGGPMGRPRRLAGRADCQGSPTPLPRSNQTLRVQQRRYRASARPFTSFTTADSRRLYWPLRTKKPPAASAAGGQWRRRESKPHTTALSCCPATTYPMCVILCVISGACDMVNFSGPKTVSEPCAERESVPSSRRGWESSRRHHHLGRRTVHSLRISFKFGNHRD